MYRLGLLKTRITGYVSKSLVSFCSVDRMLSGDNVVQAFVRVDTQTGEKQTWFPGTRCFCEELVFVPGPHAATQETDGFLLGMVFDASQNRSFLAVSPVNANPCRTGLLIKDCYDHLHSLWPSSSCQSSCKKHASQHSCLQGLKHRGAVAIRAHWLVLHASASGNDSLALSLFGGCLRGQGVACSTMHCMSSVHCRASTSA